MLVILDEGSLGLLIVETRCHLGSNGFIFIDPRRESVDHIK